MTAEIKRGQPPVHDGENHFVMLGGDSSNPTWREYIDQFTPAGRRIVTAAARCVRKSPFYKAAADMFCNYYYFATDGGQTLAFSWRAWGDFMQALVNRHEGYMAYYMSGWRPSRE